MKIKSLFFLFKDPFSIYLIFKTKLEEFTPAAWCPYKAKNKVEVLSKPGLISIYLYTKFII